MKSPIHKLFSLWILAILTSLAMSACQARPPETVVHGLAETLAVRTLVARQGLAYVATATPTPITVTPTAITQQSGSSIFPITDTPVPSLTPIRNSSSLQTNNNSCHNKAEFIRDVTIPDGTSLKPGAFFTKIWKVRNIGTCTWTEHYKLVFTFGDRLNGLSPKPIGQIVLPGQTTELSIDLVAPKNPNVYQGNWVLEDEQGFQFATGHSVDDCFWVSIWVDQPQLSNMFRICGGGG